MQVQRKTPGPIATSCNTCFTAPIARIVGGNGIFCGQMCKECLQVNERKVLVYGGIRCSCREHHDITTVFYREDFMSMEYLYTSKRIQKREKRLQERDQQDEPQNQQQPRQDNVQLLPQVIID